MRLIPLVSLLVFGASCTAAEAAPPKGPVVLELFTSEGCSSCPPADALLAEVGALPGVFALELHVDYWDDLGWKDPFSQADFSERQAVYDGVFHRDGVYTPQLVANGVAEGVGSSRSRVAELLATVAPASAPVTVTARRTDGGVHVAAAAPGAPAGAELVVAVAESGLSTEVKRGENAGRRLAHGAVVRRLLKLPASGEIDVNLADAADGKLAVVALLQDVKSRRILGVARAPL